MIRDERIKDVSAGEFRSKLYIDSVTEYGGVYEYVTSENGKDELIGLYHENPIICPSFSYMYCLKVSNVRDRFFKQAVSDYTYINPNIDNKGLYLMAEHIQKYLVKRDSSTRISLISISDIFKEVKKLHKAFESENDKIRLETIVVVFNKNSILTKEEKISFSRMVRHHRKSIVYGQLIHEEAQIMLEERKYYAISKRDVHKGMSGIRGLSTYKSFNKYITAATEELLNEDLRIKLIKSEKEYNKLKEYNALRNAGLTSVEAMKKLRISNRTAINFNKIINKIKIGELLTELWYLSQPK